jgi:predicted helicase
VLYRKAPFSCKIFPTPAKVVTLSKGLYDSYVRAIRWASDRIGYSGVVGFVTNAGFLEAKTTDGLRKCLVDEFSSVYVFHLRGLRGLKTAGERAKREGGQIFGAASGAAICIFFLVKNPNAIRNGEIHFHDIGDYLGRDEKLAKISSFVAIGGIEAADGWQTITPDIHGDWLKQRDDSFNEYLALGDKKGDGPRLFENFSLGVVTNRDAWCYNASKASVIANMTRMIAFYNAESARLSQSHPGLDKRQREAILDGFINPDAAQIAWTRSLKQDLAKDKLFAFDQTCLVPGLYRPFNKQWLYFNRRFNEMVYQMPRFFPDAAAKNVVIGVSASDSRSAYSVFISDHVTSLHAVDMVGSQYFPLYLYDDSEPEAAKASPGQSALFSEAGQPALASATKRRDAITAEGLTHFQSAYPDGSKIKEGMVFNVKRTDKS